MATRAAYGVALAKLGASNTKVIALDGDTKNSTFSDKFKAVRLALGSLHQRILSMQAHPERYIECFIAEQNLVGVAVGCQTRQRTIPFCR